MKVEGDNVKEELKEIILMGIGAMSLTNEKAKELKKELLEKGTEIYNNGKILNEELKHNIESKIEESKENKNKLTKEEIQKQINSMSKKEKEELLNQLKEK